MVQRDPDPARPSLRMRATSSFGCGACGQSDVFRDRQWREQPAADGGHTTGWEGVSPCPCNPHSTQEVISQSASPFHHSPGHGFLCSASAADTWPGLDPRHIAVQWREGRCTPPSPLFLLLPQPSLEERRVHVRGGRSVPSVHLLHTVTSLRLHPDRRCH